MSEKSGSVYAERAERVRADLDEILEENSLLRTALIRLVAECCDGDGALLRPSRAAVNQAALAIAGKS